MSRVNLGSVRIGWLCSCFERWQKRDLKYLERIRQKMFVLLVTCPLFGLPKKKKPLTFRGDEGAPKKMFFLHSSDKKKSDGTYTKKEKNRWRSTLLKYKSISKLFKRYFLKDSLRNHTDSLLLCFFNFILLNVNNFTSFPICKAVCKYSFTDTIF